MKIAQPVNNRVKISSVNYLDTEEGLGHKPVKNKGKWLFRAEANTLASPFKRGINHVLSYPA